jgi:hypothetical protein
MEVSGTKARFHREARSTRLRPGAAARPHASGSRRRRYAIACVTAAMALAAAGCGSTADTSSSSFNVPRVQPKPGPFTTITFTVDSGKPASYVAPTGGTTEVVSSLGTFAGAAAAGQIGKEQAAAASDGDQTLFVVNETVGATAESSLFLVTTGQSFDAAMNGLALDAPVQHELAVSVPAGGDSVIAVADAQADTAPFVAGSLGLNANNIVNNLFMANKSRIDLDADANSNVGGSQADIYMSGLGELAAVTMVNGARAAQWTSPLAPTLDTCASLSPDKWSSTLIQGGLNSLENAEMQQYYGISSYGAWCVISREGRYGYLLQTQASPLSSLNFQFVLWKKTADY